MLRRIVCALLLCGLVGCGSGSRVSVEDSHSPGNAVSVYVVKAGDTLYSIAFRYGLDFRKVAEVNSIADPYIIYPGQKLYLWKVAPAAPVAAAPAPSAPVAAVPRPAAPAAGTAAGIPIGTTAGNSVGTAAGTSAVIVTAVPGIASQVVTQVAVPPGPVYQGGTAPPPAVPSAPAAAPQAAAVSAPEIAPQFPATPMPQSATVASPPAVPSASDAAPQAAAVSGSEIGPQTPATPIPQSAAAASPTAATAPAPTAPPSPASAAPIPAPVPSPPPIPAHTPRPGAAVTAWRWPSSGAVTRGYSASVHKGIDINGNRGDPVYAVADGTVVYAGTGIVGFGELIIVKHNDIYISAYGHNDRLLVKENEVVGAGQMIAEKGSSGTDTVKLHFEIRREGKPIDPLKVLPAR